MRQGGRYGHPWRHHPRQALGRASQGARQEEVLGEQIGQPHTVPCKVTVKCGSVTVRMVPVPTGSGIVAACVPKKVLQFAGIEDVFTSSRGFTKTLGNFVKVYQLRSLPNPVLHAH